MLQLLLIRCGWACWQGGCWALGRGVTGPQADTLPTLCPDPVGDYPLLPVGHRAECGYPGPCLWCVCCCPSLAGGQPHHGHLGWLLLTDQHIFSRSPGEQVKHQACAGHHHRAVPGLLCHPGKRGWAGQCRAALGAPFQSAKARPPGPGSGFECLSGAVFSKFKSLRSHLVCLLTRQVLGALPRVPSYRSG